MVSRAQSPNAKQKPSFGSSGFYCYENLIYIIIHVLTQAVLGVCKWKTLLGSTAYKLTGALRPSRHTMVGFRGSCARWHPAPCALIRAAFPQKVVLMLLSCEPCFGLYTHGLLGVICPFVCPSPGPSPLSGHDNFPGSALHSLPATRVPGISYQAWGANLA